MKTSMTVDEQINILKAFKAGKTIQAYHNGNWLDLNEDALSRPVTLRIKPDAKEIVTGTTGKRDEAAIAKALIFYKACYVDAINDFLDFTKENINDYISTDDQNLFTIDTESFSNDIREYFQTTDNKKIQL